MTFEEKLFIYMMAQKIQIMQKELYTCCITDLTGYLRNPKTDMRL